MNKLVIIFLFLTLFFALNGHGQTQSTITLVSDVWCPYNCEPESDKPGFVVELAQEIFAKNNIKVIYKTMPWERALVEVSKGTFHGAICTNTDEETPHKLLGQKNTFSDWPGSIFVKKGNPWRFNWKQPIEDYKKLKGKIGLIKGYEYADAKTLKKMNKVLWVGGDEPLQKLIPLLINGRIEAINEEPYVFQWTFGELKRLGKIPADADYEFAGASGEPTDLHIGFCPSCTKLSEIFDKGVKEAKENGRLLELLKRYNVRPPK